MTKCILCGAEHERYWGGEPNMYCAQCQVRRDVARGSMHMVAEGVWVGDQLAAARFNGTRVCVHEIRPMYIEPTVPTHGYIHAPILSARPLSKINRAAQASPVLLDRVATIIDALVASAMPVMIHCHGGIERSPLAAAWYLAHYCDYASFTDAYDHVKRVRPITADRTAWVPA